LLRTHWLNVSDPHHKDQIEFLAQSAYERFDFL